MTPLDDFDLIGNLNGFLHKIGLLPLSQASLTRNAADPIAGSIVQHHPRSDIPFDAICFLTSLVHIDLQDGTPEFRPRFDTNPVPRLLETLSQIALLPPFTRHVSDYFTPILPELVSRWILKLSFEEDGQYSEQVCSYWSTECNQYHSVDKNVVLQSSAEIEKIKSSLRSIFHAFGLLLPTHPTLFPFLVLFMRHPALAIDPFHLLPIETLVPAPELSVPLPINHALYQADAVPQLLLSLLRILRIAPHLPFPGLVLKGWVLPPCLLNLLKFHPHRGTRQLAWHCWRSWQGSTLCSQLSKDIKDRYVWKRTPSDSCLIKDHFTSPWPTKPHEQPLDTLEYTSMDLVVDSPSNDLIKVEERLSSKWNVQNLENPTSPSASYEVVFRMVDAWVLEVDETHTINQIESAPNLTFFQPTNELPRLFVENCHLSKLVTSMEGILVLKFCALPLPVTTMKLPPPAISEVHRNGTQSEGKDDRRSASFVSTSSSRVALRSLSHHLSARYPILLSGPPSSGKNTVIRYLACRLWSRKVFTNHSFLDRAEFDQNVVILNLASRTLDAKSLLGSYTSSVTDPGKFVFSEGPLVKAMKEGKWVVCQDVDRASDDVLSVIKQLADLMSHRAQFEIGGGYGGHGGRNGVGIDLGAQAGWVSANERFMLFATRTCQSDHCKSFFGQQYWKEVTLNSLDKEDVANIVRFHAPHFSQNVRERLINAWEDVSSVQVDSSRRRSCQLIDLLKWIRRIQALLVENQVLSSISQNPVLQEHIFLEGVDIFLASSDTLLAVFEHLKKEADLNVAHALAKHLDLNQERSAYCIYRRVPDFILPTNKRKAGKQKNCVDIGRVKQAINNSSLEPLSTCSSPFALTKSTLVLLERLAACLRLSEPALLVGETGTGKTSVVGYLARLVGKKLVSLNLSNQSEASDLLGGFKPLDASEDGKLQAHLLVDGFLSTFGESFNLSRNQEFVHAIRKAALKGRYTRLVALLKDAIRALRDRLNPKTNTDGSRGLTDAHDSREPNKRRRINSSANTISASSHMPSRALLQDYLFQVNQFEEKFVRSPSNHMRFRFVEGPLVRALRNGDWILLDEINLGTTETLEALSGLLRHPDASVILSERGDLTAVARHPEFRLIACMNPATDVGKRDLPISLRSKFTEIYVQPPDNDREALLSIISQHLNELCASDKRIIADIADCYCSIRTLAGNGSLADGANSPPHYSMRTLSRALTFARDISSSLPLRRALVEGFLMAFVTTLDTKSGQVVSRLIDRNLVLTGKNSQSIMIQPPKKPENPESVIQVGPFWLRKATPVEDHGQSPEYVLTDSVKSKIIDLARAITTGRYPVLIQGPTSSGKTSIVAYLARITGHSFIRINNHEHTDIQEYIGSYTTDPETGRLCFKPGALVRALRQGAWVVLDELNLAPSDVLEALNRLLDDNRELFIPETQEIVKPHPNFMLFATQNPPGLYGGRKVLSRAFRNRFLELHFDDVPKDELEVILCQRCAIAPSYANKIVGVFTELQRRRQTDKVFEQKHSFVTLRDLFRWGSRGAIGYEELAEEGYMLLAERARGEEEKETVKQVLEDVMRVTINPQGLYQEVILPKTLVATAACKRLFKLVSRCLQFNEPVLLVGEAGCGKTSVCEALSSFTNQRLRIVNLHRNSEVGDLLGSQRPVRQRTEIIQAALQNLRRCLAALDLDGSITWDDSDVEQIIGATERILANKGTSGSSIKALDRARTALSQLRKSTALFDWADGPLVKAMQEGDNILLDEISLADDSVLERLNSLLEPERSITLAERGGGSLDQMQITAHPNFQIMATMNPGGDFGKRELSPALRNRFTEIWVPLVSDPTDRLAIYSDRLSRQITESSVHSSFSPSECAAQIISFSEFYSQAPATAHFACRELSLRDGLAWCDFIRSCPCLPLPLSLIHGAEMTVLDRLGTAGYGQDLPSNLIHNFKSSCLDYLCTLVNVSRSDAELSSLISFIPGGMTIGDFTLKCSTSAVRDPDRKDYSFSAQTVSQNALRIVRALQVPKAVLLEGSPGVGKTTMVEALAKISGKRLQRINLSDQTDLLDLFGTDAPVDGGSAGQFAWKDASFLDALQKGDWVLLDEMNLAPQTVLEGLNGCLDHRGTVYVPEIDRSFQQHPEFKVFAAQNPHHQGGSRKGLPKSLIDRFTIVFMKEMEKSDLLKICTEMAPQLDFSTVSRMVDFNYRLIQETTQSSSFASFGSPWEFNLRDLGRWLQVTTMSGDYDLQPLSPVEYIDMIYTGRFRTLADQSTSLSISTQFFDSTRISRDRQDIVELPREWVVGHSKLVKPVGIRWTAPIVAPLEIPSCLRNQAEALMRCLELRWLPILTGPDLSGKTSLVKTLAARKGVQLQLISLHSGTDTSDLVGGFEQSSAERKLITIIDDICDAIECDLEDSFLSRDVNYYRHELWRRELNYLKSLVFSQTTGQLTSAALGIVKQILDHCPGPKFADFERPMLEIQAQKSACRFEWIDGPLVSAMKRGEWLLIENSNMCSASVLDRLNPLFEGSGTLQLTEKGMHQGQISTVIPHPDFRILFAFNPRYGELSRAMRNRGVEIALLSELQPSDFASPSRPTVSHQNLTCSKSMAYTIRQFIDNRYESTIAIPKPPPQDLVMRWTCQALIHPPIHYPLLARTFDHFLPPSSPDRMLMALLSRLLIPETLNIIRNWAGFNDATFLFTNEAFDIAIASRSAPDLQDPIKVLGHQSFLRLVIATCLPIRLLSYGWGFRSSLLTECSAQFLIPKSHHVNVECFSAFVRNASNAISQHCLVILKGIFEDSCKATYEISEYQNLFESVRGLQEGTLQLINLLHSPPDHAAIGFALKTIDDSFNQAPSRWKSSFESMRSSLQPLFSSHDMCRWEPLVNIWNLFCPSWYRSAKLVALVTELKDLSRLHWGRLDSGLRSLYSELVASLMVSQEISVQSPDMTWLVGNLKQQMVANKYEKNDFAESSPMIERLGVVVERMIATVSIMTSFLQSNSDDVKIHALLAQWGSLPSEISVLFRSRAYLQDHKAAKDQADLDLNFHILQSLMAPPSDLLCPTQLSVEPFNILSQFTRSYFLYTTSSITRLVQTSTSLQQHGAVALSLDRLLSLAATTTSYLTADRENLCHSLIFRLVDRIEVSTLYPSESDPEKLNPICLKGNSKLESSIRALKLWDLYIPDVPIDPLSVQTAHHSYLQAWKSRLDQLRNLLLSHQKIKGGLPSNPRISLLDDEIEAVQLRCQETLEPSVHRSTEPGALEAIFKELKAFENQFMLGDRLNDLIDAINCLENAKDLRTLHARVENFSFSATGLIDRLNKRFPTFFDVLRPVQALLHVIIADLTLLLQESSAKLSGSSVQLLANFIEMLTTSTAAIAAADLQESPPNEKTQAILAHEVGLSDLLLLLIGAIAKSSTKVFESSQSLGLLPFYDSLWQLWCRDRIRQQKEAEEQAQEFKPRGHSFMIKSDEEIEEEELLALFPSYEHAPTRLQVPNSSSDLVTFRHISILCQMHLSITLGASTNESSGISFESLRRQLVMTIAAKHGLSLPSSLDQSSLAFQLDILCHLLDSTGSVGSSTTSNFYIDSNIHEATRVIPIVTALAMRIETLMAQWPEMMNLDEILQRCRKIAGLSAESPLALIIPQLEALIAQVEDSQKYCCTENSLASFQSDLTALVVSWRRLELGSWATLIQREIDSFHSTSDTWWFRLYELIVRGYSAHSHSPGTDEAKSYLRDCAVVLDQFIADSNLGQFRSRFLLLKSFRSLVKASFAVSDQDGWIPISELLDGIIYFYSHYEATFDQKILDAHRAAQKEIENYIQLASWKDVNIIALRQSSQKSHRHLYKSVKKFRTVLQGPVKDLLQRWNVKKLKDIEAPPTTIFHDHEQLARPDLSQPSWDRLMSTISIHSYLKEPGIVLKRLERLVGSQAFLSQEALEAAPVINHLSTHIHSVAKELSEAKIPPGEAGERFARNLDLRKRQAFSQLLKKLRALGIGTSPTDRLRLQLSDPVVVMSQQLLGPASCESLKAHCEDADELLFALLKEMPTFRKVRSQHHPDISNSDMERLIGSVESGLALILAERPILSLLVGTITNIERSLSRMLDLLQCQVLHPTLLTGTQISEICQRTAQHRSLHVDSIKEVSQSIGRLSERRENASFKEITHVLEKLIVKSINHELPIDSIANASRTSLTLLTPSEAQGFQNVNANWRNAADDLEALVGDCPDLSFVLSPLVRQLKNHQPVDLNLNHGHCHSSSEKPLMALKKLTDSILVVIQDLMKEDHQVDGLKPTSHPGLLRKAHSEFANLTRRCHPKDLLKHVLDFNEALSLLANSEESLLLLRVATSFLRQFFRLIFKHCVDYLHWHRSNLHLLHTVVAIGGNIAEKGFCKPDFSDEKEDGKGMDGPSQDGTGLGCGQGGKDVSDEIEDDMQLEGLQGEVEGDEQAPEKEANKEDKAFETKDDFDASLEDVEDVEEDEALQSDKDNDEDSIEDGVGKTDPLDSGAVDEKFWEGQEEGEDDSDNNPADMGAKANKPMPEDSELKAQEHDLGNEQSKGPDDEADVSSLQENGNPDDNHSSDCEPDEKTNNKQNDLSDEEDQNDAEIPPEDNIVPMMDHVDNSEILDLPGDLELEDHESEAEKDSVHNSIMDFDDTAPQPLDEDKPEVGLGQENESPSDRGQDDSYPPQLPGEIQLQEDFSNRTEDPGNDNRNGTEGGGTSSASTAMNPVQDLNEYKPDQNHHLEDQKPEGISNDGNDPQKPTPASQPQPEPTEQIGDGTDGELLSKHAKPMEHSEDNRDTSRPNPLRSLGDAMEDWKQRLQRIMDAELKDCQENGEDRLDEAAEVEYLQDDNTTLECPQAPGPATEEQACQGLNNMQIDDCENEMDISRAAGPNLLPPPAEPFQAPSKEERANLAEAAVLGPNVGQAMVEDGQAPNCHDMQEILGDLREDEDPVDTPQLNPDLERLGPSSSDVWRQYQQLTQRPASLLTEKLRLILEPTTATRLQGEYRTGKRLNMRKLVPYIASDYTKDRIWLRRTKPAQRDYKILLSVDDSRSMADSRCADLAFQTLALVTSALSKLEVGEVAIAKFGSSFDVLQPFGRNAGNFKKLNSPIDGFTFSQQQTNVRLAVARAIETFSIAEQSSTSPSCNDTWKLGIIISDGICQDHEEVKVLLRKATQERIMFVFLVLDSLHQHVSRRKGDEKPLESGLNDSSIISMNSVSYVNGPNGQMELKMERYLDTFPFEYYIILRDAEALPNVLGSTLRQFFEKVNT